MINQFRIWQDAGFEAGIDQVTTESVLQKISGLNVLIKFSGKLLEGIPGNKDRAAHFQLLLKKAKAMNLETAVENVNRLEQLEFLAKAECNEGQGLLISKPRTMQDLLFLLRRRKIW